MPTEKFDKHYIIRMKRQKTESIIFPMPCVTSEENAIFIAKKRNPDWEIDAVVEITEQQCNELLK